jgi:hypothetical protein
VKGVEPSQGLEVANSVGSLKQFTPERTDALRMEKNL